MKILNLLLLFLIGVFAAEEKLRFDASVNKLMNIIINSLYKSKDVFLRELISNASDALDKIRLLHLSGKESLGVNSDLNITISVDKSKGEIRITDSGIGMTREDLKNNLGTIAKSGTSEFMAKLEGGNESVSNLIGKFGVGFYSVFLIADRVQVVSKNNHDDQLIWESMNQEDFTITTDPNGDTLKRGTQIILHVKEDAKEFLDTAKLRHLIEAHSQYIQFPIYLWESTTVEEEVEPSEEDEQDVEDVTDKEVEKKTVKKEVFDWELINKQKPIWVRKPAEVTEDEYNSFYKAFSKDNNDPITYSHFRAEGDVEFSSLLFIPTTLKEDIMAAAYTNTIKNLKIFVRRVFITDDLTDLLPKFLSFVTGVIDSDDLPLNVSRETLQNNSQMKIIKKKILGKVLDMIKSLMDDEEKYLTFYKEFGRNLKLGIVENQMSKKVTEKLITFLRFHSSKTGNMISLSDYVKGMTKDQPQLYYVVGESVKEIESLPYLENILAKGYDILYLTDALDPYLAQTEFFKTFENVTLQNIAKSGVDLGGDDKEAYAELKKKFEPLLKRLKRTLSVYISDARISRQLSTSPCAVIASGQALDAASEKLLKSQQSAKKNPLFDYYLRQKYTFEINPNHPIILGLLEKAEDTSDVIEDTLHVLFESTIIASGFSVRNPKKFGLKIQTVIKKSLGIEAIIDDDYNAGYADGSEKESTDEDFKESIKDTIDNVVESHIKDGDSVADQNNESESTHEKESEDNDSHVEL